MEGRHANRDQTQHKQLQREQNLGLYRRHRVKDGKMANAMMQPNKWKNRHQARAEYTAVSKVSTCEITDFILT